MKIAALAKMFLFLALLLPCWAAADVGISLRLDRTETALNHTVRMEVRVSGSRETDEEPVLHGLEDFLVTRGGTSSRVEIINGQVNSGVTMTYFLQPQKTGTFTIGPAEITVDGRKIASNSETLVVKKPSQAAAEDRGPIFIEASLSAGKVYVDQQAFYILKLYRRVSVDNLSLNLPELDNLVLKQLGRPSEYQSTIVGVAYQVIEIRYALMASKVGDYVIGPGKMSMRIRQSGSQSLFDDFFKDPFTGFSSGRPFTAVIKPIQIKVRPLPEKGKPSGFSGLVGDFQIESTMEPQQLKAGDSATLTVQVSGMGNANRIPDIDLPELPFARTYGDRPTLNQKLDKKGLGGTKTMKWALVPQKAGQFEVPPVTVSFFNPETQAYKVLKTPAYTLSVLPGDSEQTAASVVSSEIGINGAKPAKKEIQQIGQDILPIHTTARALSVPYRKLTSGAFLWIALTGPFSIYLILLCGLKLQNRSPQRQAMVKARNAFKRFTKRCRQDRLSNADLIDAFKDYLNDKFELSLGTLTAGEAEKLIREKGAGIETARKVQALILNIETLVYAGQDFTDANPIGDLLNLVRDLEKEIR